MKNFFILILLVVGCTTHKYTYDTVRKIPKQKFVPFGTLWLKGNIFIDETEVTNFAYSEFLYWVSHHNYNEETYKSLLPDTVCWVRFSAFNADYYQNFYLRNLVFRDYPVVGISYEQAVEFCKWRTKVSNRYIYFKRNKSLKKITTDTTTKIPEYVEYRLPTKEEWEYAAAAGLNFCDYPMGYENLVDKNNIPVSNTLEYFSYYKNDYKNAAYKCGDTLELVMPADPVYAGKPNRYGLYNMLGNVSELLEDSTVKGLNYNEPIYSIPDKDTNMPEILVPSYNSSKIYNYKLNKKFTQ